MTQKGFVGLFVLILMAIGIAGVAYKFWDGTFNIENFDIEKPFQKQSSKVSWDEAVILVKDCKVKSSSQTHYLEIFLELKDGKRVRTTEPQLEEISRVIKSASNVCGEVLESTE